MQRCYFYGDMLFEFVKSLLPRANKEVGTDYVVSLYAQDPNANIYDICMRDLSITGIEDTHRELIMLLLEYGDSKDLDKSYNFTRDEIAEIEHRGLADRLVRTQDKKRLQRYRAWKGACRTEVDKYVCSDVTGLTKTYV